MCSESVDEVGGNITAVELHPLDILGLEFQALGLFNGDDAVFADFIHHLSDQVANRCGPGRKWWPRWRFLLWW